MRYLEGVFIPVFDFKCMPYIPIFRTGPRICKLTAMRINSSRPINLTNSSFHIGKSQTHFLGLFIRKHFNCFFVDGPGRCNSEARSRLCDIKFKHFESIFITYCSSSSFINPHRMSCKTIFLLQIAVEEIQWFRKFRRTSIESLFKQVSCSLKLSTLVTSEEFS